MHGCCHEGKNLKVMDGDVHVANIVCDENGICFKFTEEAKAMHKKKNEEYCEKHPSECKHE